MEEVRLMLLKFIFSHVFVVPQKVIQLSEMHEVEKFKPCKSKSKKNQQVVNFN